MKPHKTIFLCLIVIHKELAFDYFTEWPFRVIQEEALYQFLLPVVINLFLEKTKEYGLTIMRLVMILLMSIWIDFWQMN